MKLKEFIEGFIKQKFFNKFFADDFFKQIMDIERIQNHFELMYGVRLEIEIKPIDQAEGRWFGKGVVERLISLNDIANKFKK